MLHGKCCKRMQHPKPTSHSSMPLENTSLLIRALAQLNDAAWAETLLPKLIDNGSAGKFALACKQLRQLCHGTQQRIQLPAGAHARPDLLYTIAKIPQHFPACSEVAFGVESWMDGMTVVPVLSRLQHLSRLDLNVTASSPFVIASVLELLRGQLTTVRHLQLTTDRSWAANGHAWQALGRATQLTGLSVMFDHTVNTPAAKLEHLSALAALSSLASLKVGAFCMGEEQQYSALQNLSSLTALQLPLVHHHTGLAAISSCTALRSLKLLALPAAGEWPAFGKAECAALSHLVQLTKLRAPNIEGAGSSPHFLAALSALQLLQQLQVDDFGEDALPCLAGLTRLTELTSIWQANGAMTPNPNPSSNSTPHVCPQVRKLSGSGPIPFHAFGQLQECVAMDTWQCSTLQSLARHCTSLQQLSQQDSSMQGTSLPRGAPFAERVGSIQALATLPHLAALTYSANDNYELAALAVLTRLTSLWLAVPVESTCCSGQGLMHLLQLRELEELVLDMSGLLLSQTQALHVLCGVQRVRRVRVLVPKAHGHFWTSALHLVAEAGLWTAGRPAGVEVECLSDGESDDFSDLDGDSEAGSEDW